MFRAVERPVNYKRRAREWIDKMLFLWTREPTASPKGSNWFTWVTTAAVFWTCRRPLLKAIRGIVSPLRIIRRHAPSRMRLINRGKNLKNEKSIGGRGTVPNRQSLILHPKLAMVTGIKTKVKRLGTGDGLDLSPLTPCTNVNKISHKIHYRVTRSGRVYGTYVPQ